jgi:hypothetical protein
MLIAEPVSVIAWFALRNPRPTTPAPEVRDEIQRLDAQPRIPTGIPGKSLTFRTPEDFE